MDGERKTIFDSEARLYSFRKRMEWLRRSDKDMFSIIDELVFEIKKLEERVKELENGREN